MQKRILSILLALSLCTALFCVPAAAEHSDDLAVRGAGYSAVLYDSTNGLPTSDANAILQSRDGFIWIGSYAGLIRYDGRDFYRYDSSYGISSVFSLFADSQDRLWIGTNDSGVSVLKDEQFTFYDREEGLRSSSVRSITEDSEGNILIATTMGIAYVDTEGTLHTLDVPELNTQYICELVPGADGLIYGVTLSGDFFTIDHLRLSAWYSAESLELGVVNTVYPDPEQPGWVYVGTQSSTIWHLDPKTGTKNAQKAEIQPGTVVNNLRLIDGRIWVCTVNGIGYLDEKFEYVALSELPMNNSIDHIIADYEGNLWFTSTRQGVMKIVQNRFTDLWDLAELEPRVVNATCKCSGDLYVGTDTGLVILNAADRPVENKLTKLLEGARIRSIRLDSKGRMWICTNSELGLVCFNPKKGKWTTFNSQNGLSSDRPRVILERRDGSIAVATNAGVDIIENGAVVRSYGEQQGISNTQILTLEESADGRLFLGSDGDGVYVVEQDETISRLGRDDGLPSEVVLRLKRDPEDENLCWIITSNSIAWMKDGVVTPVHGFPYSNNFDLYFDDDGRLWVLSSNGIYVVRREDMFSGEKIDYILYDTKCGLPCSATANSFSHLDEDGTLYISASTGVSSVNIYNDSEVKEQVRLSVPYVIADEQYYPVGEDETVTIPAGTKRLSIYPYAFSYSLNNPYVSYYLEGFDDAPQEVSRQDMGQAVYTNLSGGTYTFHLDLINTMTGKTEQSLAVKVVKEKTVYEQTWFWVLMALLGAAAAAGAVGLYFHRKTQILLKKQQEHKKLISEMSSVFASCIDLKDPYTNGHSHRVAKYSALLAKRMGKNEDEVEEIYNTALLHDIGKIAIPDAILNKPGRLNDEEYAIMKSHPQRGYDILKDVQIDPSLSIGAGYHHERIDGRGYPNGLKGDQIPEIARIIAVADTFDAMYSTRPYRKRLPLQTVADEIQRSAGTQLSPDVVKVFMELVKEGAFDNE